MFYLFFAVLLFFVPIILLYQYKPEYLLLFICCYYFLLFSIFFIKDLKELRQIKSKHNEKIKVTDVMKVFLKALIFSIPL